MVNKAPKISSSDVINIIKETRDNGFDEQESKKISKMMKGLSPEGLKEVKNYIKRAEIEEPAKKGLDELMKEAEKMNNLSYGFEGVKEGNKSEFFGKIFENPSFFMMMQGGISELVNTSISDITKESLSPSKRETLSLVIWNVMITRIGVISSGGYMMKKSLNSAQGLFGGMIDTMKDEAGQAGELMEDMDITKLGDTFERMQNLFESDEEVGVEKTEELVNEIMGYFRYLTEESFERLNSLSALAKEKNIDISPLLENPMTLKDILDDGKLNKDNVIIDISSGKIDGITGIGNLDQDKKLFMKEMVQNMNNTGGKLDSLKGQATKVAKFFTQIGFDVSDLQSFKDDLKEIPLIGGLLSTMLGFFLGDKVFEAMEDLVEEKRYKKPLSSFTKYIQNTQDLPFILDQEANEEDARYLISFLKKVEQREGDTMTNGETKKSIITERDFWKRIFAQGAIEGENPLYQQIREELKKINPNNREMSQREYLIGLKKVKLIPQSGESNTSENNENGSDEVTSEDTSNGAVVGSLGTTGVGGSLAGPEDDEVAGPEDDEVAGPEDDEVAGPEDDEVAGPEDDEVAGPEDDEVAGPEDDEVAGPEDNEVAGPEDNEVAGPEDNEVAGPEDNEVAGPEDNDLLTQLQNIQSIPFFVTLDGEPVQVDYDTSNYRLKIGDETFKISHYQDNEIPDSLVNMMQPKIIIESGKLYISTNIGSKKAINLDQFSKLLKDLSKTGEGEYISLHNGEQDKLGFNKIIT